MLAKIIAKMEQRAVFVFETYKSQELLKMSKLCPKNADQIRQQVSSCNKLKRSSIEGFEKDHCRFEKNWLL